MTHRRLTILAGVCILGMLPLIYLAWIPKVWLGDFFFGKSSVFYNTAIAQRMYRHAIQFERGDQPPPYAYYQLSRTYFIQGDLPAALQTVEKEIFYYPDHFHAHYIHGLTLGYLNREKEAIEAFGKFLESKPESWAARNDKAWLHFRIGDIDGALDTIEPAVAQNPFNPWVMNTYGVLLMNKERYAEAEGALTKALQAALAMTEEGWGVAYPGNSPEIYGTGLEAMRTSIASNLEKAKSYLREGDDN